MCCRSPTGFGNRGWQSSMVSFSFLSRVVRRCWSNPHVVHWNVYASASNTAILQTLVGPCLNQFNLSLVPCPQLVTPPYHNFPSARSSTNATRFLNRLTMRSWVRSHIYYLIFFLLTIGILSRYAAKDLVIGGLHSLWYTQNCTRTWQCCPLHVLVQKVCCCFIE